MFLNKLKGNTNTCDKHGINWRNVHGINKYIRSIQML